MTTDQIPAFMQGDWVLSAPSNGLQAIEGEGIGSCLIQAPVEIARAISLTPKMFRALVVLANIAKVESDAEYRAVLDARDVIEEVIGS